MIEEHLLCDLDRLSENDCGGKNWATNNQQKSERRECQNLRHTLSSALQRCQHSNAPTSYGRSQHEEFRCKRDCHFPFCSLI